MDVQWFCHLEPAWIRGGGSRREKRAHIFPNITDIFYCDTHHNPPWCSPWTVHLLCLAPAWWDAVALPPPPPPPPPPPLPHHHHRYAPPADPRSSFYPPPPGPRTRPCRSSSALSPSRWTGPSFSASLCRWAWWGGRWWWGCPSSWCSSCSACPLAWWWCRALSYRPLPGTCGCSSVFARFRYPLLGPNFVLKRKIYRDWKQ